MNVSRCYRGFVDKKTHLDGSRICREAIEQTKCLELLLDGSKKLLRIYREETQKSRWIENLSRFLWRLKKESPIEMNRLGIYQEAIKLEENEFFKGGKTHRYECNKQETQPKIQLTC